MTCKELYRDMTARLGDEANAFFWFFFDRSPACAASDNGEVGAEEEERYRECIKRVESGEPMQYVFGYAPFCDLLIECRPGVLIPRYDTEVLVEEAIKSLPYGALFADICCGSGCIAAAVLKHRPDTAAICCDISGEALDLTRRNLEKYGLSERARILEFDVFGDWSVLPKADAILCNPPYISAADMEKLPENVKREPETALYGGEDGLDFYRRIISASRDFFKGRPHIIFEIGYDQKEPLARLSPYPCKFKKDLSGNDRICILRGISMKEKLILIFGGRSAEYEVSLHSVYNVSKALDREKYDVVRLGITKDGVWYSYYGDDEKIKDGSWCTDKENLHPLSFIMQTGIKEDDTGVIFGKDIPVFPVVHGSYCEDGRLQGLLDMCGFKYVGPGTASSAVCMDKYITKLIISHRDIPMADFVLIHRGISDEKVIKKVEEKFDYPVFVKPANAGSSVGASKVKRREQLVDAVNEARKFDDKVLVEEYINGREIEVAVMGNDEPFASRPGEICPNSEFYDYNTKYINDTATYHIPAELPDEISEKIREYAVRIYMALGCRGLSRVDFFVAGDRIVFNEINTIPGFTSISMYPSLMQDHGFTYAEVVEELFKYAKE